MPYCKAIPHMNHFSDHLDLEVAQQALTDTLIEARRSQRLGWMAVVAFTVAASTNDSGALRVFGGTISADSTQMIVVFAFAAYVFQMKYLLGRVDSCIRLLSAGGEQSAHRAESLVVTFPWLGSPLPSWCKRSLFRSLGSYIVYVLGWAAWIIPMELWLTADNPVARPRRVDGIHFVSLSVFLGSILAHLLFTRLQASMRKLRWVGDTDRMRRSSGFAEMSLFATVQVVAAIGTLVVPVHLR